MPSARGRREDASIPMYIKVLRRILSGSLKTADFAGRARWRIGIDGGVAQRLTTHPAEESRPAFSPDGKTLAFSASYEGPTEVYTLSLDGGVPVRQTFEGGNALVVGWTPGGEVLYSTRRYSTLPNTQLARIEP